jgi:hypothetical protein
MAGSSSFLLQLPDPCLLAMLQCCTSDLRSLFSAARAHPRLHQAAAVALSSISVDSVTQQQQVDGLLRYLTAHAEHVNYLKVGPPHPPHHIDLNLAWDPTTLCQLPSSLKLRSLKLTYMNVQLQPGDGSQGLLRPGLALTRLQLSFCMLLDREEGLIAALSQLPGLQHLSITHMAINQSINVTPVAMKLKKLMPAIH